MANIAVEGPRHSAAFDRCSDAAEQAARHMTDVSRRYGVGPLQQVQESLRLRFGPRKLHRQEYYDLGLFDPAMPMVEKQQYAGAIATAALNKRLSPDLSVSRRLARPDASHFTGLTAPKGLRAPPPPKQLCQATGNANAVLRLITVNSSDVPLLLYALWTIPLDLETPRPEAGILCAVDVHSGVVTKAFTGLGLQSRAVTHHPRTSAQIVGLTLPYWATVVQMAEATHARVPELGICATSVVLAEAGPTVLECDARPDHVHYQLSHRRGIFNREFAAVWAATAKRSRRQPVPTSTSDAGILQVT